MKEEEGISRTNEKLLAAHDVRETAGGAEIGQYALLSLYFIDVVLAFDFHPLSLHVFLYFCNKTF